MACSCDKANIEIDASRLPPGAPDLDAVLSDDTRRRALVVLEKKDDWIGLADLAAEVVEKEQQCEGSDPGTGIDWERIDQVRTMLYHVHLPMLEDADLVEYNQRERSVRSVD